MYGVNTVKTWHGKRWAVVDNDNNIVELSDEKNKRVVNLLIFDFNESGHQEAVDYKNSLKY